MRQGSAASYAKSIGGTGGMLVPGLSQAEAMRPLTREARCPYQVDNNPAAITWATAVLRTCGRKSGIIWRLARLSSG